MPSAVTGGIPWLTHSNARTPITVGGIPIAAGASCREDQLLLARLDLGEVGTAETRLEVELGREPDEDPLALSAVFSLVLGAGGWRASVRQAREREQTSWLAGFGSGLR